MDDRTFLELLLLRPPPAPPQRVAPRGDAQCLVKLLLETFHGLVHIEGTVHLYPPRETLPQMHVHARREVARLGRAVEAAWEISVTS